MFQNDSNRVINSRCRIIICWLYIATDSISCSDLHFCEAVLKKISKKHRSNVPVDVMSPAHTDKSYEVKAANPTTLTERRVRPRVSHQKSRSGCVNCKVRRVKVCLSIHGTVGHCVRFTPHSNLQIVRWKQAILHKMSKAWLSLQVARPRRTRSYRLKTRLNCRYPAFIAPQQTSRAKLCVYGHFFH